MYVPVNLIRIFRRSWGVGALCYLALLMASKLWIGAKGHPAEPVLPVGMFTQWLPMLPDSRSASAVRFAYRDSAPDRLDLPVVVLVHGSPGTSNDFQKLTALLPLNRFRVIAPDLPGFGYSTRDLPDYSFRTDARYLIALLDRLQIPQAQFVGFSMGGGVVLSVEDLAPARVRSIVMLSAIGVQEHEWFGTYNRNHILHGLQLAALTVLFRATPHFGLLDGIPFDIPYARNFYDSDQRPLRGILGHYAGPMLIIHGRKDPLVPLEAALEHHRLVPQSELFILDDNHFMTFTHPEVFRDRLTVFLNRSAGAR